MSDGSCAGKTVTAPRETAAATTGNPHTWQDTAQALQAWAPTCRQRRAALGALLSRGSRGLTGQRPFPCFVFPPAPVRSQTARAGSEIVAPMGNQPVAAHGGRLRRDPGRPEVHPVGTSSAQRCQRLREAQRANKTSNAPGGSPRGVSPPGPTQADPHAQCSERTQPQRT